MRGAIRTPSSSAASQYLSPPHDRILDDYAPPLSQGGGSRPHGQPDELVPCTQVAERVQVRRERVVGREVVTRNWRTPSARCWAPPGERSASRASDHLPFPACRVIPTGESCL